MQIKRGMVVTSFFSSYYKSEDVVMFLEVMTMLSFDCIDFAMSYTNILCGKLFSSVWAMSSYLKQPVRVKCAAKIPR